MVRLAGFLETNFHTTNSTVGQYYIDLEKVSTMLPVREWCLLLPLVPATLLGQGTFMCPGTSEREVRYLGRDFWY